MLRLVAEATGRDHILGEVPPGVVHSVDPVVRNPPAFVLKGLSPAVPAGREEELRALSASE